MSSQIVLFVFLSYILWLFVIEVRRRTGVSGALWSVVIWVVVIGSRPVSTWLNFGAATGTQAEAYDEGNPFERWIYFVLIAHGLFTLSRRGVRLAGIVKVNKWLFVFFAYWAASVLWSDAPFMALKRLIKDMGNVVMVLVILTERDPIEASKAVFVRCACLLVPFSVMLIKFFGDLGRTYHVWSGEMMYTGVATHKNTLGVLVLVCGLFLMWDFLDRWHQKSVPRNWLGVVNDGLLMLMTVWLLLKSRSSTSIVCMAVGVAIYFGLGIPAIRARARHLGLYVFGGGVVIWVLDSVVDLKKLVVVDILGRDLTLTTRTEVWPMLLAKSDGVLLGAGFNSFWSGDRLAVIYRELGIIQAHNGYLETYLNGGAVGVLLLLVLLFTSAQTIKHKLVAGSDFARISLMILVIAIVYDFTEAAFSKMGLIWFVLLLAITQCPRGKLRLRP